MGVIPRSSWGNLDVLRLKLSVDFSKNFRYNTNTIKKGKRKMRKGKIYCPANGWDCPYYKDGECGLNDPLEDCDDFAYFWEEADDFICSDEERTAFEND